MKWGKGKKQIVADVVSGKLQETGKGGFEPTWQEQQELEGGSVENQIMEDRQLTKRQ